MFLYSQPSPKNFIMIDTELQLFKFQKIAYVDLGSQAKGQLTFPELHQFDIISIVLNLGLYFVT